MKNGKEAISHHIKETGNIEVGKLHTQYLSKNSPQKDRSPAKLHEQVNKSQDVPDSLKVFVFPKYILVLQHNRTHRDEDFELTYVKFS